MAAKWCQAALNTPGQVTAIPFLHSPHGAGPREHPRMCVSCQDFGKGHHTTGLTVPKATLQLVSAVLKGRGIMQFY